MGVWNECPKTSILGFFQKKPVPSLLRISIFRNCTSLEFHQNFHHSPGIFQYLFFHPPGMLSKLSSLPWNFPVFILPPPGMLLKFLSLPGIFQYLFFHPPGMLLKFLSLPGIFLFFSFHLLEIFKIQTPCNSVVLNKGSTEFFSGKAYFTVLMDSSLRPLGPRPLVQNGHQADIKWVRD